jgi:hypothetical protein
MHRLRDVIRSADPKGLVQDEVPITHGGFRLLVDHHDDR